MSESNSSQIFLSYSREDVAFARELREWLLEQGYQPWMDLFDIPAGARWPDEIDKALERAGAVIGVMTPASLASENAKNEWDWAIANRRSLLLLLIEPCNVPFHYVSRNYIDFTAGQAAGFELLAAELGREDRVGTHLTISRHDDVALRAGHEASTARPLIQRPGDVLVGRDQELEQGIAQLGAALAGRGQVLLLAGEPGIGKTRLAEEIAARASERGAGVFWGHCYEWEGAPAYWPWIEILRGFIEPMEAATLRSLLGPGAPFIAQIVPEIGDRLPDIGEFPRMNPDQARFRLFDAVVRFVRLACREQPCVLALDDLHWADEASLLLLEFFVRELASDPVLLIGTYRDVEVRRDHPLSRTLGGLVRSRDAHRVVLRGLDAASIAELIERETGQGASERVVQTIHETTEGNPFFTGEIVRLLAQADRDVWQGNADLGQVIPEGVREAVGRRLDRLSPAANELLAIGSVIGREFDLELLVQATASAPDEILELLDEALAIRIIEEPERVGRYRFSHALVQQTLYDELTSSRRVQLHSRVGQALETGRAGNLVASYEDLARHFAIAPLGDNLGKAVDYATKAGDQAMRRLAWESALGHYSSAVELADEYRVLDDRAHCDLLLRLYEAQMRTGATDAGKTTFNRVLPLVDETDDLDLLARAALGVVTTDLFAIANDPMRLDSTEDSRRSLLERLLAQLSPHDRERRIRAMSKLAIHLVGVPDSVERRTAFVQEAVEAARELGDNDVLAYALLAHYHAAARQDDPLDQVQWNLLQTQEIIEAASAADNADLAAWGSMFRLAALMQSGSIDEAVDELERFTGWTNQTRTAVDLLAAASLAARLAYVRGRFDTGDQILRDSGFEAQLAESRTTRLIWSTVALEARRDQGRLEELEPLFRQRIEEFSERSLPWQDLALLLCERGKLDEARAIYERFRTAGFSAVASSLEVTPAGLALDLAPFGDMAVRLSARDDFEELYELLSPYQPLFGFTLLGTYGPVTLQLGLLATAMERWGEAEQHFSDAIAMSERMGASPYLARSRYAYADMLSSRNQPGDRYHALELLDDALAMAAEIGMPPLEQQVTTLQERLRAVR